MLIDRNRYHRKKVIGGNLLGNLWKVAGNALATFSKYSSKNLPAIKNTLTPIVKNLGSKAIEGATDGVKSIAKSQVENIYQNITKPKNTIPEQVKDTIEDISSTPAVKKVLTQKAKEIINEDSRTTLSNIINGEGLQKRKNINKHSKMILKNIIHGSGIKRLI